MLPVVWLLPDRSGGCGSSELVAASVVTSVSQSLWLRLGRCGSCSCSGVAFVVVVLRVLLGELLRGGNVLSSSVVVV